VSGGPDEEYVFDDDFIAAASFKERPAERRRPRPWARWRWRWLAYRDRRAKAQRRPRRPRIGARGLTILIVLGLLGLAVLLTKLDPLGLRPSTPEIRITTIVPSPADSPRPVPSKA
jgi:hypothetical protein